jgi:hypothetical protein
MRATSETSDTPGVHPGEGRGSTDRGAPVVEHARLDRRRIQCILASFDHLIQSYKHFGRNLSSHYPKLPLHLSEDCKIAYFVQRDLAIDFQEPLGVVDKTAKAVLRHAAVEIEAFDE